MERSGESRELWVAVHLIGSASQSDPQMQPRYVDSDAPSHATALLAVAVVKGTPDAAGPLPPLAAALHAAVPSYICTCRLCERYMSSSTGP